MMPYRLLTFAMFWGECYHKAPRCLVPLSNIQNYDRHENIPQIFALGEEKTQLYVWNLVSKFVTLEEIIT